MVMVSTPEPPKFSTSVPRASCHTGSVRNVTIALDEETARRVLMEAARRDMSLSRFVGEILERTCAASSGRGGDPRLPIAPPPGADRARRALPPPGRGSTTVPVFADTDVLVYAADPGAGDERPGVARAHDRATSGSAESPGALPVGPWRPGGSQRFRHAGVRDRVPGIFSGPKVL